MKKNTVKILDVPFTEKDEAKMLGARWNPEIRKWFIPASLNPKLFSKWIETGKDDSDNPANCDAEE